jgi:hypothetical protein
LRLEFRLRGLGMRVECCDLYLERFWESGIGYRVSGIGYRVHGFGFESWLWVGTWSLRNEVALGVFVVALTYSIK